MTRELTAHSERGFSLLEILITVAIIGIVANIAVLAYAGTITKAQVARGLGDADAIFKAARSYALDSGDYPRTRGWGRRPPELDELLTGVAFERSDLRYRWRRQRRRYGLLIRANSDQEILDLIGAEWSGPSIRSRRQIFLYEAR